MAGSTATERELERLLTVRALELKRERHGPDADPDGVTAYIRERKLSVRQHNGWRYVTQSRSINLSEPDQAGVMVAEQSLPLKDCILNGHVALVFELQYIVEIQGNAQTVAIGQQVHMPRINSAAKLEEEELDFEMMTGPGETITGDLLESGRAPELTGGSAHFAFRFNAWVSQNRQPPEGSRSTLNRTYNFQASFLNAPVAVKSISDTTENTNNILNSWRGPNPAQAQPPFNQYPYANQPQVVAPPDHQFVDFGGPTLAPGPANLDHLGRGTANFADFRVDDHGMANDEAVKQALQLLASANGQPANNDMGPQAFEAQQKHILNEIDSARKGF